MHSSSALCSIIQTLAAITITTGTTVGRLEFEFMSRTIDHLSSLGILLGYAVHITSVEQHLAGVPDRDHLQISIAGSVPAALTASVQNALIWFSQHR